jgi:hypothetical protein
MSVETIDLITDLKRAFQLAFKSPAGETVLKELAGYCRAFTTTAHENQHLSFVLEGRRQVYLRIQHYLNLNPEELNELFNIRGDYDA